MLIDGTLLSVALQNVLRNAYHYTEVGSISLDYVEGAERCGIEIQDTGKGMDTALMATAFNKYSRGEDTLSRSTEGLGLGLYLAQQIAHLHGGEITIGSAVGKGTKVSIWISNE